MAKKKLSRKQLLKEPDEFITTTGRLIGWARENSKALIIGTAVFFGLLLIITVYGVVDSRQAANAQAALGEAMAKYQAAAGDNQEVQALESVRADFDSLIDDYAGQPAGRLARVVYGHYCLAAEAFDDAIAQYQAALSHFENDPSLANVILNGLATAYQQKGDYDQAMAQYAKIVAGPQAMLKDAALFHLGRLHEQMGSTDEGRKLYRQLSEDYPQSMYSNLVRAKVSG